MKDKKEKDQEKENQENASDFSIGSWTPTKKLTVFDAWALSFGGLIGYGAFVMPGTVFLKGAGILGTLIAMQVGAVTMLIISYGYGYMAEKFPVSGGQFIYAERAFGKKHGFLCAWFLGLCYLTIIPLDAMALSVFFRVIYGKVFQFGLLYRISGFDVYFGELLVSTAVLILFIRLYSLKDFKNWLANPERHGDNFNSRNTDYFISFALRGRSKAFKFQSPVLP